MSPRTFQDDVINYEDETPFLEDDDLDTLSCKPTPLPTKEISVLLAQWIAEFVIDNSITGSPCLNQMRNGGRFVRRTPARRIRVQLVRELPIVGEDVRKAGSLVRGKFSTPLCKITGLAEGDDRGGGDLKHFRLPALAIFLGGFLICKYDCATYAAKYFRGVCGTIPSIFTNQKITNTHPDGSARDLRIWTYRENDAWRLCVVFPQ